MLIAATGALEAGEDSPILYRGDFEPMLAQIAADGFRGVELHILDSARIDRKRLWRLLERNALRLTSIGTGSAYGALGLSLVHRDAAVRGRTVRHLEEHMITLEPSGGLVIVGLIAGRRADCGGDARVQRALLAESLQTLDALAGRHGVKVALEMMNRYESDFLYTIDEGVAFLREAGGLRHTCLHVDSVSMNISETDIGAAIRRGKGYIGHVHLADNDRWYPGHGHYDFTETLSALMDIGYDGALALELKAKPSTAEAARRSLETLGGLLADLTARRG